MSQIITRTKSKVTSKKEIPWKKDSRCFQGSKHLFEIFSISGDSEISIYYFALSKIMNNYTNERLEVRCTLEVKLKNPLSFARQDIIIPRQIFAELNNSR